jgi:aspartate aminotransferase-like enzyme
MISHRGSGINALMDELQAGLEQVFVTKRPVFIATCSATGLMEAAVRNAGRTRILSLVNGAFSKRFAEIARACGFEVDEIDVGWGSAHDPKVLSERLGQTKYDAVTMAHSETSTGVLNDIRSLSASAREHDDVLVLVDSVSSFAAAEIRPDDWGIDFLLTGSQKAFALPPGLAFGVASERMLERAAGAKSKGYYFDLNVYQESWEKKQSPTTPGLSTMFALQLQLRRMCAEGIESRWARHREMAETTWAWVERMRADGVGLEIAAPEGYRSPAVTALRPPAGRTGPDVTKAMRERGWVVGGGYGKWKESTFRVGHMGDHTLEHLSELLDVLSGVVR